MKNTPFILLLLGLAFIWLGLTGRLGAVLAAIFEPGTLSATQGDGGALIPPVVEPSSRSSSEGSSSDEPTTPDETPGDIPDVGSPSDGFPPADIGGDLF